MIKVSKGAVTFYGMFIVEGFEGRGLRGASRAQTLSYELLNVPRLPRDIKAAFGAHCHYAMFRHQ